MRFWVLFTIGLVFAVPTMSEAQQATQDQMTEQSDTIVGFYKCEGANPDGTTYEGIVEITKVPDAYIVQWAFEDGSSVVGVGILEGSTFAVSYLGSGPAIVVYKIDGNRLVGRWTMIGIRGDTISIQEISAETLTKMERAPLPELSLPERPRPQPSGIVL